MKPKYRFLGRECGRYKWRAYSSMHGWEGFSRPVDVVHCDIEWFWGKTRPLTLEQTAIKNMAMRFMNDTEDHEMSILHDEGVYRHIRFKKSGDSAYYYDLKTEPGSLTITGDMGTYSFARITDMFDFFTGSVNPQYWAEKLTAVDRYGYEEFSRPVFDRYVAEHIENFIDSYGPGIDTELESSNDPEDIEELQEQQLAQTNFTNGIKDAVREHLRCEINNSHQAHEALQDFQPLKECDNFSFDDSWEWDFTQYTTHFLWALFAITRGIARYKEYQTKWPRIAKTKISTIEVKPLTSSQTA